jgi:hypothetical protein
LHLFTDILGRVGNSLQDRRELIGRDHQPDLRAKRVAFGLLCEGNAKYAIGMGHICDPFYKIFDWCIFGHGELLLLIEFSNLL